MKSQSVNKFHFFLKAAEEDSGTETDDETGGPDEGKTKKTFFPNFRQVLTNLCKTIVVARSWEIEKIKSSPVILYLIDVSDMKEKW